MSPNQQSAEAVFIPVTFRKLPPVVWVRTGPACRRGRGAAGADDSPSPGDGEVGEYAVLLVLVARVRLQALKQPWPPLSQGRPAPPVAPSHDWTAL